MSIYKCTTCEGKYSDACDDSLQYFHACAPEKDENGKYRERKDKRDENAGKKLEGKGRTAV